MIKTGGLLASHHHYPVRWDALRFDPECQAFRIDLTLEDLRAGPSEFDEDDFDWGDRSRSYLHPHYSIGRYSTSAGLLPTSVRRTGRPRYRNLRT